VPDAAWSPAAVMSVLLALTAYIRNQPGAAATTNPTVLDDPRPIQRSDYIERVDARHAGAVPRPHSQCLWFHAAACPGTQAAPHLRWRNLALAVLIIGGHSAYGFAARQYGP